MLCVLHIGVEKTGSTALQASFTANRQELLRQGVFYPVMGDVAHHALVDSALDEPRAGAVPPAGVDTPDQWRAWMRAHLQEEVAASGAHTVLLSSELLHSQLRRPDQVARIKDILDAWATDYQVAVYLRRQDRATVSRLSTDLRSGLTPAPDFSWMPWLWIFDYARGLDLWASVFGEERIVPRVYDPVARALSDDFYAAYLPEVSSVDLVEPRSTNAALSAEAQGYLLAFNRHPPRWARNIRLLRRRFTAFLEATLPGPSAAPSRSQASACYQQYAASNAAVVERWFHGEALFDDDFTRYPEHGRPIPEVSRADLRAMLGRFVEGRSRKDVGTAG